MKSKLVVKIFIIFGLSSFANAEPYVSDHVIEVVTLGNAMICATVLKETDSLLSCTRIAYNYGNLKDSQIADFLDSDAELIRQYMLDGKYRGWTQEQMANAIATLEETAQKLR